MRLATAHTLFALILILSGLMLDDPNKWKPPQTEPAPRVFATLTPTFTPSPTATWTPSPTSTPIPIPPSPTPSPTALLASPAAVLNEDLNVLHHLELIRECESGHNYAVVSDNGLYFGAYQFSIQTWQSVGGVGRPDHASPAEQDYKAYVLYTTGGPGHWPHCQYYRR